MVHKQDITCPHYGGNELRKHGRSRVGTQRWRCQGCLRSFQLGYAYKANEPGTGERIDAHSLWRQRCALSRPACWASAPTPSAAPSKKSPAQVNPILVDRAEAKGFGSLEVCYTTEWDEFWSFVGSKACQRWTWYLIERQSGLVLAWHNSPAHRLGPRAAALQGKPPAHQRLPLRRVGAFTRLLPQEYLNRVGKQSTWRIERRNLNFRTHIKRLGRKSICFSKNEQIPDNVIGMYIEKYYFRHGSFS